MGQIANQMVLEAIYKWRKHRKERQRIPVWHMNGAGNDFMVLDARGKQLDFEKLALELCGMSGADGFMAVDVSDIANFKLHFYNADGSRGEMCGNGARCICRFAYENGICKEQMTVETDAGIVLGERLSESQYRVRLNNPGILDLYRKEDVAYVELGSPGVPHAVKEMEGLCWEQMEELKEMARSLRYDPAFPKGANANLYTWLSEKEIRILTFERGVEDYTLACGTGSASTAVVLWKEGRLKDNRLTVQNRGGTLEIMIEEAGGELTALYLEGPTETVKILEV
jgi:diaminopimelate epimerase